MKVLAGSWKQDSVVIVKKSMSGKWLELWFPAGLWKSDKIPVGDIIQFDVVTEENKASILGKAGWGAAGLLVLGPLGLLAGVLGGGNKRDRVMVIKTRDGREAMLKGNSKDAEMLMAATFGNKPDLVKMIDASPQERIEPGP